MSQADVEKLVMKPTSRRRLGKYVILGRIGAGGMGKIYLAFHPGPAGIEKLVVIKRLHSHLTQDDVLVSSFLDEARLSMALSHPNIVHTYDVGDVDGRYYMAMEHIDGQNLGAVLRTSKRSGNYPSSLQWGGLFSAVLDGLHAAHIAKDARGRPLNIIHRDISPQNVLISYEGVPKLVDFGIAKAAMRINETDAGVLKGKYAYMSPEQCEAKELDARSDVFSAGVVFWEMLAGRRLYKSSNIVKSIDRILNETPPPPSRYNGDTLKSLSDIALKALAKKRGNRFESAEAFKEAIDEAMLAAGVRYRRNEMRDLMRKSFADVIDAQRKVLDRVLSGQSVDAVDDETAAGEEGDSESEFQVPNLQMKGHESEPTTPSASLSPLITQDSELASQIANTRRNPPSAPPPMTMSAGGPTAPSMTPSWGKITDDEAGAVTAHTQSLPEPPPQQPPQDQERRSAAWLIPFLLFLLIGGGVVGFFYMQPGRSVIVADTPPVEDDSGETVTGVPTDAPAADATVRPQETPDEPANGADPGTPKATATSSDTASSTPSNKADGATTEGENSEANDSSPNQGTKSARDKRRRSKTGKTKRKGSTRTAAASGDAKRSNDRPNNTADDALPTGDGPSKVTGAVSPATPPKNTDFGYLTLDTVPWTTVYLDGKRLGNTPLSGVKVPTGEIKLILKNKSEGIAKPYLVRIKKGATTRKRLGLK